MNNIAQYFEHIAENLHLLEDELELDLSAIHAIEFTPHLGDCGWWMDVNESTEDGMYVWCQRDRQSVCEVVFSGCYADSVYPQPTNA